MVAQIRNIFCSKDLIWTWTERIIRGRYQQSLLGWLWAVVQPTASVIILTIIFTQIIPIDTGGIPYPIFSFIAIVPWTFFSSSLSDMSNSVVQNMSLVTKIYFPREALTIAAMLARLLDFFIAFTIIIILMLIYRMPIYPLGWVLLPLVLAVQIIFVFGLGCATAALNVFFRDVQPLLTLVLQVWFYATPVIYPLSRVPENLRPLYFLNPMAGIIEAYRTLLLEGSLPGSYFPTTALISIIVLIAGFWFFKRVEFLFADII